MPAMKLMSRTMSLVELTTIPVVSKPRTDRSGNLEGHFQAQDGLTFEIIQGHFHASLLRPR